VIKNILILKDNVLYLKKDRDLLKISVNFLNELSDNYFIITKSFIDLKNKNLSFNEESFMNVDCIVTIKPSSDSIKKIDGNILVDHLDRNEFKKITYPIYIQKNSLISYLRSTDCIWNLKDALKELTFIVELT
jgi:hypothetical protein|tara:strand:- start:787 stop:1185 length:399 start_codon:yes stop_codon:yes gene_type:complete